MAGKTKSAIRRVLAVHRVAAVLAVLIAGSGTALADICTDLNARLIALGGRESAPTGTAQLGQELNRLRNLAAGQRCRGGFLFFGGSGGPDCPRILGQIKRLEAQLRGQGRADPTDLRRLEQQRILREMNFHECRRMAPQRHAGYEAVCVRHCDGYFFQVSFSTSRSSFEQHAALCAARYPEGAASLYVRRSGADANDLVSTEGARYAEQSFAFRHEADYDPSCPQPLKMVSPQEIAEIQKAADAGAAARGVPTEAVPLPLRKLPASTDPETVALAGGALPLEKVRSIIAEAAAPAPEMRSVGPVAYYRLPQPATAPAEAKNVAPDEAARTKKAPLRGGSMPETGAQHGQTE